MKQNEVINQVEFLNSYSLLEKSIFYTVSNSGKITTSEKQKKLKTFFLSLVNLPIGAFVTVNLKIEKNSSYTNIDGFLTNAHKVSDNLTLRELTNLLMLFSLHTKRFYCLIQNDDKIFCYRLNTCYSPKQVLLKDKNSCCIVQKTVKDALTEKEFTIDSKLKNGVRIYGFDDETEKKDNEKISIMFTLDKISGETLNDKIIENEKKASEKKTA